MGINSTRKQKVHSLTGRITLELLLDSFKSVKRNRGAAGIDKVSVKMFEANLIDNLRALLRDLKNGSFEPFPLRRAYVPKNETELRPLGIPAVRDRVAQEVVRRLLNPIFEPLFLVSSHGFRQGRNCHGAIRQALALHQRGLRVVLDADIRAFFDGLPQPVIIDAVAAEVADGNILRLIFGKGYSFLGFVLSAHARRMRPKSLQKFKDKIRALSGRHYNFESETIVRLNRVIRGTALYFGASFSTCRWQFQKLDSWIRMRLRCMKFKRKQASDNYKLRNRTFIKLGLLSLEQFCLAATAKA